MGSDRVVIKEVTDYKIPLEIINTEGIRDYIYEDGAQKKIPDLINELWLSAHINNRVIACFRFQAVTSVACQCHPLVRKEYRASYAHEAVMQAFTWCVVRKPHIRQYIAMIPTCHRHIIIFVRQIGMTFVGKLPGAYMRNGAPVDLAIFSIDPEKINERRSRWVM